MNSTSGHDHVMNVTAQLARNSGLKVRVNRKVDTTAADNNKQGKQGDVDLGQFVRVRVVKTLELETRTLRRLQAARTRFGCSALLQFARSENFGKISQLQLQLRISFLITGCGMPLDRNDPNQKKLKEQLVVTPRTVFKHLPVCNAAAACIYTARQCFAAVRIRRPSSPSKSG